MHFIRTVLRLPHLTTLVLATAAASPAADHTFRYTPAPADNPLRGLVPYAGQGTRPDGSQVFPHSMEFQYLGLSEVMRARDTFDWAPVDTLLDRIAARGNQAVLRFVLEYPGKTDLIPPFLVDAGLTVHRYQNTNTHPFPPADVATPDYEDPQLHAALKSFVAALGARYDADPRLAFVEAGLLGTWGEWHTHPRTDLWASKKTQSLVMDAYAAAFDATPVLLRYPAGADDYAYADNATAPFGYHDDSFAFATRHTGEKDEDWFFVTKLRNAGTTEKWQRFPVGGEVRPEVWGCCFDDPPCTPPGQAFADCVTDTHVSWLRDSGVFTKPLSAERRSRALAAVRRMGYELHVAKASFPDRTPGSFKVQVTLQNRGVAPLYHPWPAELALADPSKKLHAVQTTSWNLTTVLHSESPAILTHKFDPAGTPPGTYQLLLRIHNPLPGGRALRFANTSQDQTVDGWLTLGEISVGR